MSEKQKPNDLFDAPNMRGLLTFRSHSENKQGNFLLLLGNASLLSETYISVCIR